HTLSLASQPIENSFVLSFFTYWSVPRRLWPITSQPGKDVGLSLLQEFSSMCLLEILQRRASDLESKDLRSDRWYWTLDGSGEFSVASARKGIDDNGSNRRSIKVPKLKIEAKKEEKRSLETISRRRKIDKIDQDPGILLVQHDVEIHGRYGHEIESKFVFDVAKEVSTAEKDWHGGLSWLEEEK
ncbi:hypothetical protein Tco_1046479, partial [Tanacetum coccineum]